MVRAGDTLQDCEVVQRVLSGDRETYALLVNRYKNMVFRTALTRLGNPDSAEDIAQEAFAKAFENLERLKNPSYFASWITSITVNLCRDVGRKEMREISSFKRLIDIEKVALSTGNATRYDKELIRALRKNIGRLPETYRRAIELFYTDEMPCKRIADVLKTSERTVITRLYRARKQILHMLKKEGLA